MVRWNMMRMAVAVAAVALVGCNCDKPEVTCTDTEISWEAPTSDTTTSPFDVSFSVKASGNPFSIDKAQITIDGKTVVGTVSGARATFSGVTSSAGEQQLVATISQGTCSKTYAPRAITVQGEMCTTPAVSAVTFPQDTAAPMGVLNGTELPAGEHVQVRVAASCSTGVQVRIKRGADVVSELTDFSAGVAVVTTTLPDGDNARYDLFAELVKNGAAVNTTASNPEASASIEVARTPPVVALNVRAVFGPMNDANTGMAGFQARIPGTAPAGTTCTLAVTGQTPQTVVATMSGDVSADFTLTSGSYTATLTCTDPAGNVGTAMATFRVDFEPPMVTITSPANVDGGATMVVTQSPLTLTITTDAENNSQVIVRRDGMLATNGEVQNGTASLEVAFSADGDYLLEVEVTDTAGNTSTATIRVTVSLTGCGAAFLRPVTCPRLLTAAQVINGMYTPQVQSKPVCAGQPARLFRVDYIADGGMLPEAAAGTTTVATNGVSSFQPIPLSNGEYDLRAEVTNLNDGGISATGVCHVTVDLNGPAITSPVVPASATVAIVNAAQDTQPGVPGVQRTLSFNGLVPTGGRVDVCTTQPFDPTRPASDGGFELRPTSVECGAGWYVLQQGVTSPVSGFSFPEGSYDIKVVVVGGGQVVPSPAVSILSDSIRPCVSGLSRRLPQDANSDARLNATELAGGSPRLEFALGCGDTPATLATASPVVVRDVTGGVAGALRASTSSFASNLYTTTLTDSYTTEAQLSLFVELTDLAGNKNLLSLPADPATFAFRVDPVAPSCDIQSPGASQTLVGQAGAPGGMFPVIVGTATDVGSNGVRVTFGMTARDLTPSNGTAQTSYAVTGTNTYAVTAVCTDDSGNSTTATPRSITIDLDAPTCSISSPTATTYSVNQIATAISVAGAEGRMVTIRSSLQGAPLGSLTVGSGVATGNISYPNGTQTVTAEVSDQAGNLCTATVSGVVVNSTSCGLSLTNAVTNAAGNWFNRSNTGSLGATSGVIASVNVNSADCRSGQTVTLQRTAPTTGSASTTTTAANGDASFANVAVNDGETWTVTINNGTGILTTQTFRVGLRVPSATAVTINGNALTSGQALFFVAPTGNINLEASAGTPKLTTYFADGVAGTAGSQTNVAVTGVNGTRYGTDNGLLEVRYGAAAVVSQVVSAEPYDLAATQMTLPHNTTGTFVVRVTSAAGNSVDVISSSAAVDVIAPAAPSVTSALASARAATVNLTWSPVYDDGTDSGSGGLTGGPVAQPAGYDVRWSTSSVPSNNALATVADYFGSSSKQDGVATWSASAIVRPVTGLPPINTYYLVVRARDEVGNYSDYPTSVQTVANPWSTVTLSGPVASSSFGTSLRVAALVGNDTTPDLVVAAPTQTGGGAVYVYDSSLLSTSQTTCGTGCQMLSPSTSVGSQFGHDLAVGNVGAVGSESITDLVVAGLGGATPVFGRAVLYFGTTNSGFVTANAIEFRGLDTNNRIGTSLATSVAIIRDITGDGRDEIAFAAPSQSSNRGRVLIYRGRDRADWVTLATATDTTVMPSVAYVPVSAATADYVIDGPLPLLVSPAGNAFGQNRRGLVSVNDLDGDTFPDLAIPTSRQTINQYRIIGSVAIKASSAASPLDTTTGYVQLLTRTAGTDNGTTAGLGTASVGNRDLIDSTGLDFATSLPNVSPANGLVFVHSAFSSMPANPSPTLTLTGPARFGAVLTAGQLDGDADNDLVAATDNASGNTVWAIFRRSGTYETGTFDTTPCFYVSRLRGVDVTGNNSSRIGSALAVTNAGELVVGDMFTNEVRIWR